MEKTFRENPFRENPLRRRNSYLNNPRKPLNKTYGTNNQSNNQSDNQSGNQSDKRKKLNQLRVIESKIFPTDDSLKIIFMFNQILFENKTSIIISLKQSDNSTYVLLSSNFKRMYLMTLFICKYNIKPYFVKYSLTNNLNPYSNNKTVEKFYNIIFKSDKLFSLSDAVTNKFINLYEFKKGIMEFLNSYSILNKKYDFLYNNINSECLYVNYISGKMSIIMFDYTYSCDLHTRKTSYKSKVYGKDFYEMKKLYDLNEVSEKIEGNYDLICIIFIINICNNYLNDIPKELILNKEDIRFFNTTEKLYKKIALLLKKDFLKIL